MLSLLTRGAYLAGFVGQSCPARRMAYMGVSDAPASRHGIGLVSNVQMHAKENRVNDPVCACLCPVALAVLRS